MKYSTFNKTKNNPLKEPMFFGQNVNVSRYDQQRHSVFETLIEKQLSFFWRPEEVDVSTDRSEFNNLSDNEKHIYISNLKYQTLLDSIQGRSPNMALLPIVSIPELETWIETWSFSETIHSRSYTHILRNIFSDPSPVFEDIVENEQIIARADAVSKHYDTLIDAIQKYQQYGTGTHTVNGETVEVSLRDLKRKLYIAMVAINALEAIRFYVSFACSFAFAEQGKLVGQGGIIKLIARDEQLHLQGTQYILNSWKNGMDDFEMAAIAAELEDDAISIFRETADQEKEWAEYLFKDGSMIGLNKEILCDYVEYITNRRMTSVGLKPLYPEVKDSPLPWMSSWLSSDSVQVAPQEQEISSYLVGQIESDVEDNAFKGFEL
ncbi:class Ia ribonucleoside-diphosphate reductase subunit beta [Vibrio sp. 10N.286.48.C11]|uniref:class Ia ribonucleoside-diphosphate reductase subunit beta n=1 Tax=Vibrio sp. 10N.286.48.C11 TaxID=3229698 RepID=UPI00354FF667